MDSNERAKGAGPSTEAEYEERRKATRRGVFLIACAIAAYFVIGVWAGWIP